MLGNIINNDHSTNKSEYPISRTKILNPIKWDIKIISPTSSCLSTLYDFYLIILIWYFFGVTHTSGVSTIHHYRSATLNFRFFCLFLLFSNYVQWINCAFTKLINISFIPTHASYFLRNCAEISQIIVSCCCGTKILILSL